MNWALEIGKLNRLVESGKSMDEIGEIYGVSRQRMYQIFNRYSLLTPNRKRSSYLSSLTSKQYWLYHILCRRDVSKAERERIIENLELPDFCPILGIPLDYDAGEGIASDNSPSIDQFLPRGGYHLENVTIMSWRANRLKSNATAKELELIAGFMRSRS